MFFRTDLAMEAAAQLSSQKRGILQDVKKAKDLTITEVTIKSDKAAKEIGKLKGKYITIEFPPLTDNFENTDSRLEVISKQIARLIPPDGLAFVVGLGNSNITPDAFGPQTVGSILATRHITGEVAKSTGLDSLRPVATLSPGVLGQTGLDVSEIIQSIIKKIKPSVLIVVDALAAMDSNRLGTTIQISDTGISPGSGVGNPRPVISQETTGVKVISIGVPTVVDAQTLTNNILRCLGKDEIDLKNNSASCNKSMVVTPREIDLLIERASKLTAMAINSALQPAFSIDDIMALV